MDFSKFKTATVEDIQISAQAQAEGFAWALDVVVSAKSLKKAREALLVLVEHYNRVVVDAEREINARK